MARRTKPAISLILKKPGICFITATLLQVLEKSCFTNFNTADFLKRDIAIEYYQLTSANRLWPSTSPLFLNELVRYLFWFIVKWRARLGVLFLNSVQIIFFFVMLKWNILSSVPKLHCFLRCFIWTLMVHALPNFSRGKVGHVLLP